MVGETVSLCSIGREMSQLQLLKLAKVEDGQIDGREIVEKGWQSSASVAQWEKRQLGRGRKILVTGSTKQRLDNFCVKQLDGYYEHRERLEQTSSLQSRIGLHSGNGVLNTPYEYETQLLNSHQACGNIQPVAKLRLATRARVRVRVSVPPHLSITLCSKDQKEEAMASGGRFFVHIQKVNDLQMKIEDV